MFYKYFCNFVVLSNEFHELRNKPSTVRDDPAGFFLRKSWSDSKIVVVDLGRHEGGLLKDTN